MSYLFIITITVIIMEIFLILAVKHYFYSNIKNAFSAQIKASANFYDSYLSSVSLKNNVANNTDIFWNNASSEVQIIDASKEMLMDSIGNFTTGKIDDKDIISALNGKEGFYINNSKNLLCISYPLKSSGKIEGVLRFLVSLKETDTIILKTGLILACFGLLAIIITGISSIFLSNNITKPIQDVTNMAKRIASGRLNERLIKNRNDEIGELSDAINFMTDEILRNDKLKNEFMASISHELRTPLTSIKGWASTIRTGDLTNKTEILDGLEIIETESDRLSSLVNELLDFSKFISGKITLNKDYIDIRAVVLLVKKEMDPKASRSSINFSVILEEDLPFLLADENRIKQLLINILDNAFKFTPQNGYVTLTVKVLSDELLISVEDSGSGISPEDLTHVTEKFYKGNNKFSSSGLGLSICKEIVELHNGKLDINSVLNKGTSILVYLPFTEV